ncbi:uncharacterized protein EI97DRAFT_136953 [Westerdykella ornata]|uniref:Uncharacterized protein n=1 Tax=Westerdykella ornata TaxID=318751 RepID=A0A6A6JD30_WESOR|nr:uncharacterized protein EI97DRAFT_136953 [Westerdykella ornata]KAF2274144.1 hypothetical protein EI97DRAFT_136953 [Westerdykella ornata]
MPKPANKVAKAQSKAIIPAPFTAAPAELLPLLSSFDKKSVYIAHVDQHPAWFKKGIYSVPVVLNVAIGLLVIWRLYVQVPWYWMLLMSIMGNANETTIYFAKLTWGKLIAKVFWRALTFLFDFLLITVIAPWPYTFFLERPGNPVLWRLRIGFRDEEIYVRQSRGWGAEDLLGEAEGSSGKAGADSPFFKTRVLPAIDAGRLRAKTGYLLMDKDYDLEFAAMVRATELVDKKELDLDMLRKTVFVWVGPEESGQWAMWDCWKLDEGSETEARKKIVLFKDRLTAMGKENLFFKWVELVQYESSAPGGFTHDRQMATAQKAKELFEAQGVDFDTFVKEIGGLEGMPGMD